MPDTSLIRTNSSWMMTEQGFRQAISLGFSIWIARLYGPAGLGTLSFALSLCALFSVFSTLGLNRILVRELANPVRLESSESLIGVTITLRLLAGVMAALVVVVAGYLLAPESLDLVVVLAIGYFLTPFDAIDLYFQSRLQSRTVAQARISAFVISSCVKALLLIRGVDLTLIAAAYLFDWVCAAAALYLAYARAAGVARLGLRDGRLARSLIGECWPEIIAGFSALVFMKIDQVMLQVMRGAAEVGIMAVSTRLSEAWYFIPAAIVSSTYPVIVGLSHTDPIAAERRQRALYRLLVILAAGAGVAATLLAGPVIEILYGVRFSAAVHVLIIQTWCGLFMSLGIASGAWLMAHKLGRFNLYRNAGGAALNVTLNLLLIPEYGAVGAAWATLAAFAFAFFVFDFCTPQMHSIGRQKLRALGLG